MNSGSLAAALESNQCVTDRDTTLTHLPGLGRWRFEEILIIDGSESGDFELLQLFGRFHCAAIANTNCCGEDEQRSYALLEVFKGPLGPLWLKQTLPSLERSGVVVTFKGSHINNKLRKSQS